jgi:hypothetical protein
MNQPYFIERSGGTWEGRWHCVDEGRTYRKTSFDKMELVRYARQNDFRVVLVD